jgi:E3 ubiquitin-protein ligase mind-bomb
MTEHAEVCATVGARVMRGPAWESADDCDGGEGGLGTVTALGPDHVAVTWDTGACGRHGSRELRLVDNGAAGVRHAGVVCSACNTLNVAGLRWRCSCAAVDLCSKCYASNEHDLAHTFQCHAYEADKGFAVGARSESRTLQLKGIFPGAKVVRGQDWSWGDQDGGPMSLPGTVRDIEGWEADSERSVAKVFWPSMGHEQVYRLGHKGKVDLQLVPGHAADGDFCFVDHLPVISVAEMEQLETYDTGEISVGDRVKIVVEAEALRDLQVGHGNYNVRMSELVGVAGTVHRITVNGDVRVQYDGKPEQNHRWTLNPSALRKIKVRPEIKKTWFIFLQTCMQF